MSENFRFDMIVEIGDRDIRVEHEKVDQRVVIEIGAFARFLEKNSLCLWMSDPQRIVALGMALAEAGFSLGEQLNKDMDDLQGKYFLAIIAASPTVLVLARTTRRPMSQKAGRQHQPVRVDE